MTPIKEKVFKAREDLKRLERLAFLQAVHRPQLYRSHESETELMVANGLNMWRLVLRLRQADIYLLLPTGGFMQALIK